MQITTRQPNYPGPTRRAWSLGATGDHLVRAAVIAILIGTAWYYLEGLIEDRLMSGVLVALAAVTLSSLATPRKHAPRVEGKIR